MDDCVPKRRRRKTVMLAIAQRCNLDCRYCYEGNKATGAMSLDLAQATVSRHFGLAENFDEIELSLHGGEPFLEFDRVRELCEWVWSKKWPKPYIIFITTNGTKVHGEAQEWCHRHKDHLYLALSLDGTPEMHDLNRSKSHGQIDVDFFRRTWPDQPVKMTVSDVTLPKLSEGIIHLHKLGFLIQCNFAYGIDWTRQESQELLAEQLSKLVDFYLANPGVQPCEMMSMRMASIGACSPEGKRLTGAGDGGDKKWCGIGTDMVAVDIDGTEYPCHLFLPISAGDRSAAHKQFNFADPSGLQDSQCAECSILPVCPTCYAINALQNGHPARRDAALCALTKLRAAACSKMQGEMLVHRDRFAATRGLGNEEILLTILGIEAVQRSATPRAPSGR